MRYNDSTWACETFPGEEGYLESIDMLSDEEGWAVGYEVFRAIAFHYYDGAWHDESPPPVEGRYLYGVDAVSDGPSGR